MAKSGSNSSGSKCGGSKGIGRPSSSHPGPGGNWPSTTNNPSGPGRGVAAPKGK